MGIPDFISELRRSIGTAPLWLMGATAVVLDGDRMLLIRRSDTGEWAPITGIIDPAEEPAVAAVREAAEEAGVEVLAERLSSTWVTDPVLYANGDRAQYLDLTFRCRYVGGDPQPVDGVPGGTSAGYVSFQGSTGRAARRRHRSEGIR